MLRPPKTWALRLGLVLLGVVGGLLVGESLVRLRVVTPNRQVIRGQGLHLVDGVPVWRDAGSAARENRECVVSHPDRIRVLVFGTSISSGIRLNTNQSFPAVLEQQLNARRPNPGFCVLNFAQPGFNAAQRYAVASREVPRYRPTVVLDQDWRLDKCNTMMMVEDAAYALSGLRLRADGFPGLRAVPDGLNEVLFRHSDLYQWLTLAWGERDDKTLFCDEARDHEKELADFASLVRTSGGKPAFFLVPDLSYPFTETSPEDKVSAETDVALSQKYGFPLEILRSVLADQDNAQLRLDSWHLNAVGNRVIGERLVPLVLELLDQAPPPDRANSTRSLNGG